MIYKKQLKTIRIHKFKLNKIQDHLKIHQQKRIIKISSSNKMKNNKNKKTQMNYYNTPIKRQIVSQIVSQTIN